MLKRLLLDQHLHLNNVGLDLIANRENKLKEEKKHTQTTKFHSISFDWRLFERKICGQRSENIENPKMKWSDDFIPTI